MRLLRLFSKSESEERAAVLIVSIGILTALVMMGLTFVTLQRMESRGSRNFLDSVGVDQLSNAVLHYTMERLRFSNAVGNADALYQVGAAYRTYSVNPEAFSNYYNFQYYVPDGDPTIDSVCEVAVLDCSSQIYIGDGLGRMNDVQNVLAALMTYVDSTVFSNADTTAASIVAASGNITDKLQVKSIIGEEKYELLKDYLTVYIPEVEETTNAAAGLNVPELGINVNTVKYQVLYAMLKQMVSDAADSDAAADKLTQEILNNRPYHGWKKSADSPWTGLVDVLGDSNLDSTMTASAFTNADDWHAARDTVIANLLPNGQYSSANLNGYARASTGWDSLSSLNATYLSLKSSGIYEIQIASRVYMAGTENVESLGDVEAVVKTHDLLHYSTQTDFNPTVGNADFAAIIDGNIELLPEIVAANNISSVDGYLTIKPDNLSSGSNTHFYVDFSDDFLADKADYSTTALVYTHPTSATGLNANPLTESSSDPGEVCSDGIFIGVDDAGTPDDSSDDFLESVFYKVSDGSTDNFSVNEGTFDLFWKPAVDVSNVTFVELLYLPFKDAAAGANGASYNGDDWNNITGVASAGDASTPNIGSANADAGAGMTSVSFKKDAGSEYEFYPGSTGQTEKVAEYQQFLWWFIDGNNMNVRIVGSIAPADGSGLDDDVDNDKDGTIDETGERQPNTPVNFSQDISSLNLKAGDWHHLMLTWDLDNGTGTSIKVYVDNQLLGTQNTDIPLLIDALKVTDAADPYSFACFGGLFRRGANATPTGTFDEIRFMKGLRPVPVPTNRRYVDVSSVTNPRYVSAIYPDANADPLPFGTVLGPISWTEYTPDDGTDGADIGVKVWVDLDNAGFSNSAEAEYILSTGSNADFTSPEQGLDDGEPLSIGYTSGKAGARLRIRAQFQDANSPDGTNYGGATGTYPNAGNVTVQAKDTPILDDMTLTILPPRPKVLLLRKVDSN